MRAALQLFSSLVIVLLIVAIYKQMQLNDNYVINITELQDQLKESQKAADYKFELCRKQLGHRSEQ